MPPGRGVPLRYGAGACDIGCAGCDAGAERAVNATWVDCPHGYVLVDGDANAPGGHPPYPICQRPECVIDASAWLAGHLAAFAPLDSCTECDSDLGPEPIELRGPSNCPIATPLTPPHLLSVGLRAVAMALAPDRGLLDNPGGGNCTFHAWFDCLSRIPIAFTRPGLELPWIPESHSDMRAACVWHARRPDVRQRAIDLCGTQVTIGEFLKGTMAAWPRSVLQGRTPSADAWCTAMLQPNFWGDEGVHAIFCDLFHAFARAWWSSPSGVQAEAYLPAIGTTPAISVELAVAGDDHCVAVLPHSSLSGGSLPAPPTPPPPPPPPPAPPRPDDDDEPESDFGTPPGSPGQGARTPPLRPALRTPGAPRRLPAGTRVTLSADTTRFRNRTRTEKRKSGMRSPPPELICHLGAASRRASDGDAPAAPTLRPSPSPERDAPPPLLLSPSMTGAHARRVKKRAHRTTDPKSADLNTGRRPEISACGSLGGDAMAGSSCSTSMGSATADGPVLLLNLAEQPDGCETRTSHDGPKVDAEAAPPSQADLSPSSERQLLDAAPVSRMRLIAWPGQLAQARGHSPLIVAPQTYPSSHRHTGSILPKGAALTRPSHQPAPSSVATQSPAGRTTALPTALPRTPARRPCRAPAPPPTRLTEQSR